MSFQYRKPTEEQLVIMNDYRDKFEELYNDIVENPDFKGGRGMSLCLTKLEEASMWLNKYITKND